jgi:hypothetical protein
MNNEIKWWSHPWAELYTWYHISYSSHYFRFYYELNPEGEKKYISLNIGYEPIHCVMSSDYSGKHKIVVGDDGGQLIEDEPELNDKVKMVIFNAIFTGEV